MIPKSKEMWLMHSQNDTGYEQRNLYRLPKIFIKSAEKHSIGLRMRFEMENKKSGRWVGGWVGGHRSFKTSSSPSKFWSPERWHDKLRTERHRQKFSRPGDLSFGNYSPPRISLPESRDKKPLAQTDRTVDYHGVQISPYEPLEARISGTGVWKPRIPLLWNRMRSHWIMFPTFRHDAVLTLKRRNINTLQESNRCFVDYAKDTKTLCGQRSSTCCLQQ